MLLMIKPFCSKNSLISSRFIKENFCTRKNGTSTIAKRITATLGKIRGYAAIRTESKKKWKKEKKKRVMCIVHNERYLIIFFLEGNSFVINKNR